MIFIGAKLDKNRFSRNKVGEIKVIEVEFKLVHSGRLEDEKSYGVLELGVFFQTIFCCCWEHKVERE